MNFERDISSRHFMSGGSGITNFSESDWPIYLAALKLHGDADFAISRRPMASHNFSGLCSLHFTGARKDTSAFFAALKLVRTAEQCAAYFEPVAPGPYAVRAVDYAGCSWLELQGFHYPCAAYAAMERVLRQWKGPTLGYWDVIDTTDPERGTINEDDDLLREEIEAKARTREAETLREMSRT